MFLELRIWEIYNVRGADCTLLSREAVTVASWRTL